MVPIFKYLKNILSSKKINNSWEEKYLAKSFDLYDLERRQREIDNKFGSNRKFQNREIQFFLTLFTLAICGVTENTAYLETWVLTLN